MGGGPAPVRAYIEELLPDLSAATPPSIKVSTRPDVMKGASPAAAR
jgi:hypothetical protein